MVDKIKEIYIKLKNIITGLDKDCDGDVDIDDKMIAAKEKANADS